MMKRKSKFTSRVIRVVASIKRGKTMSYQEVARRAGKENAARAVGNILSRYYKECVKAGKKTFPVIE